MVYYEECDQRWFLEMQNARWNIRKRKLGFTENYQIYRVLTRDATLLDQALPP